MKNILLINYEDRRLLEQRNPIALLDIASYCRAQGHTVLCRHSHNVKPTDFKNVDIVGVSCLQHLSGPNPIEYAEQFAKTYDVEVVVGGKWIKGTKLTTLDKRVLPTKQDGEEFFCAYDGDLMNSPAWDLQDLQSLGSTHIEIMSSRGCPFNCNFCNNTEKKIRRFSPERTALNAKLIKNGGAKVAFIVDDVFTINVDRMRQIRLAIKQQKAELPTRFFTHINYVTSASIAEMKLFNPARVSVGIESGDEEQLKRMGKPFVPAKAERKLADLKEAGIRVGGCFLIGYPGETVESLERTLKFIERTKDCYQRINVSLFQPVEGTVGYDQALARMPSFKGGRRSREVTYIDPNISSKTLRTYLRRMNAVL